MCGCSRPVAVFHDRVQQDSAPELAAWHPGGLGGQTTEGGSSGQAAGVYCVVRVARDVSHLVIMRSLGRTPMHSDGDDGHQGTRKIVSMKLVQVSEVIYDHQLGDRATPDIHSSNNFPIVCVFVHSDKMSGEHSK